ncbi:MAG TPA: hypothetical protein DEG42_00730, partial [Acholeplasmataceae bacterium]|nr:hypothetical protein [Acholeplasmataceae bacterium]
MGKCNMSKKFIIKTLLLILIVSNFGISFAYWASNIASGQGGSSSMIEIGQWEFNDPEVALEVTTFINDYATVLA